MSDAVTLTLRQPPEHALLADGIAADRLAALTTRAITELPVLHGGRVAQLGEFFTVTGERSAAVRIEGNLEKVEGIGAAMAGGRLSINGKIGRAHV